jgi:hypothetical protein
VVGDVAAALDFDEVDAAARERLAVEQNVLALGFAAKRDDRSVLDENPRIRFATFANRFVQPVLEIPDFAIRFGA